ncbi:MAG: hypothetical protein ACJAVV_000034 [Alphaproteobacteria bacterium]|jgi:hypothetical protein
MIKIIITETQTDLEYEDTIEQTAEAISLIEQAEKILDPLLNSRIVEENKKLDTQLTKISSILFAAHTSLRESIGLKHLNS